MLFIPDQEFFLVIFLALAMMFLIGDETMKDIKTTQALGRLIRDTRKSQRLTQVQLASASGIGRRFIVDLESGKETCHIGKILPILAMLGLEVYIRSKGE